MVSLSNKWWPRLNCKNSGKIKFPPNCNLTAYYSLQQLYKSAGFWLNIAILPCLQIATDFDKHMNPSNNNEKARD